MFQHFAFFVGIVIAVALLASHAKARPPFCRYLDFLPRVGRRHRISPSPFVQSVLVVVVVVIVVAVTVAIVNGWRGHVVKINV